MMRKKISLWKNKLHTLTYLDNRYITNTYYPYIPVLGQISAVMSVVEALVPVLANPAYNQVYQHTLDSEFPGTVFLVTAGCMVICIIAFM